MKIDILKLNLLKIVVVLSVQYSAIMYLSLSWSFLILAKMETWRITTSRQNKKEEI